MSAFYSEKAPIVIDGANVARSYGINGQFQLRGILLAVAYFQRLRHTVTVILPPKYRLKCEQDEDETSVVLRQLRDDNILSFAPGGSNDDDFIIQRAVKTGAFILSCDKFEEEKRKHPEWKAYVDNYRLNFTFVNGDDFTPNPTPLGPNGPTLKQFLNRKPRPLTEVNVLDAVSKSNQQLLSEIIRVSRQRQADSSSSRLKNRVSNEKPEKLVSPNPFRVLPVDDQLEKKDLKEEIAMADEASAEMRQGPVDTTPCDVPSPDQIPKSDDSLTTDKPIEVESKSSNPQSDDPEEESPFNHIITGCGVVIEKTGKSGIIRAQQVYSGKSCKIVEFYPYACLGSLVEGKPLPEDRIISSLVDPIELMDKYPIGTEVAFAAAFIDEMYFGQGAASALQICHKESLLCGYGHCDYEAIFSDHAFLISRSGQLHWSSCCDNSILLFKNAFHHEQRDRALNKIVQSQDWLEYECMPTPAVDLFDACPIVVKANFLRLTGLIVQLRKDYGVIRSCRVSDNIGFKNHITSDTAELAHRRKQFKIGDWVQFRIRKCEQGAKNKSGFSWKATKLEPIERPECVWDDATMEELDKSAVRKRKGAVASKALKITAFAYTGAMKSQQGVLWCDAIGRICVDPTVLINIDLSHHPPGTLVKFDACYYPDEKRHQRKDTVWYATAIHKLTKNEKKQYSNSMGDSLHCFEQATVDFYDPERRWAGLHGRDSRYILYDRFDDVMGKDDGKMKPGQCIKVAYVNPPIDSPLYVAIAVEAVGE